jgi:hypothetical protein
MLEERLNKYFVQPPPGPVAESVDVLLELHRQYIRAREYSGLSIDDVINSRQAAQYLRELWLVGCMVRKPAKANKLPSGQFRYTHISHLLPSMRSEPE